jgi:hypothetical protein
MNEFSSFTEKAEMVYKFNIKHKLETGLIFIKPLNRFVRV